MRAIRPDRVQAAASNFVGLLFGTQLETEDDLQAISDQCSPATPIALASIPGHDAAFRVENLFAGTGRLISGSFFPLFCLPYLSTRARELILAILLPAPVAMGSGEGLRLAEQAISDAARTGKSVLLKNTHLVSSWLSSGLEKRLQTLRPNSQFRLYLTMETSPKVRELLFFLFREPRR